MLPKEGSLPRKVITTNWNRLPKKMTTTTTMIIKKEVEKAAKIRLRTTTRGTQRIVRPTTETTTSHDKYYSHCRKTTSPHCRPINHNKQMISTMDEEPILQCCTLPKSQALAKWVYRIPENDFLVFFRLDFFETHVRLFMFASTSMNVCMIVVNFFRPLPMACAKGNHEALVEDLCPYMNLPIHPFPRHLMLKKWHTGSLQLRVMCFR